jgi:uncharacterized delta-60 repeat protein
MKYILSLLLICFFNTFYCQDETYLDNTFDADGSMHFNFNNSDRTKSIAIQTDGKILVAGCSTSPTNEIFLFRLNSDGSIDSSFGDNGLFIYSPDTLLQAYLPKVILSSTNKILFIIRAFEGSSIENAVEHTLVFCIEVDGTLDYTYGNNGIVTILETGGFPSCAFISPNQELFIGGGKYVDSSISNVRVKINQDGSFVEEYGSPAHAEIGLNYNLGFISDMIMLNDTVLCIGTSEIYMDNDNQRFLTAWMIDPSTGELVSEFGYNGLFEMDIEYAPNFIYSVSDLQKLSTNDILILLTADTSALVRLKPNGELDLEFGVDGVEEISFQLPCNLFHQILSNSVGQLFILGSSDIFCSGQDIGPYHIAQLSTFGEPILMNTDDGTIDIAQFIYDGGVAGFQNDGRLIVAGSFRNPIQLDLYVSRIDFQSAIGVVEVQSSREKMEHMYPNPANDVVNLSYTYPESYVPNNRNEIVIIDMQGREVLRENIFLFASSSNTIEINISSLSSGMYTLHWLSNNAWLDSSKIVVE